MKNLEKIKNSLKNELELLEDILKNTEHFLNDKEIINALLSQNNFSHYSSNDRNILSLSLNSHKKYANIYFNLGYIQIDDLRKAAYKKIIDIKNTPPAKKRDSLEKKNKELLQKIEKLNINNLRLVKILTDIQYTLISVQKNTNDTKLKALIDNKLKIFEISLSYVMEKNYYD